MSISQINETPIYDISLMSGGEPAPTSGKATVFANLSPEKPVYYTKNRSQHERDQDKLLLGRALDADPKETDTLGKLARYERNLERSLFRTLDELRQLQGPTPGIVPRPRFWMPLRWSQEYRMTGFRHITHIPASAARSTHCGPALARIPGATPPVNIPTLPTHRGGSPQLS
jgi:hypothetical protein